MTLYAHVKAGMIDAVGQPPELYFDGTRWWDLRDRNPDTLAALGWLPVTRTARPADTATTTFDYAVALVAGVPTETWTERPKTQAELDAEAAAANQTTIEGKLDAAMADVQTLLDTANTTINSGPAPYIKTLGRVARLLIRLTRRKFDGTA